MTFPLGEIAALVTALLWAVTSLLFTTAGRETTAVAPNTFKTVAASLLFALAFLLRRGALFPTEMASTDLLLLAASGVVGLAFGDSCLFQAYQDIGTRKAMLLISAAPVLGAVGGVVFLGDHLELVGIVGIGVTLMGLVWVLSEPPASEEPATAPPRHRGRGVVMGIASALGQAGGALLAKAALTRVDSLAATQVRVTAGAVGLLLAGALTGHLGTWARRVVARRGVFARLAVASVLGPFLGIWLMIVALAHTSTGIALTLMAMPPVWLLLLSPLHGGGWPSRRETLGVVVALAGMAVLFLRGG